MSEVYFEVRVTDKGGMEIHSCGTLEEIYDIVARGGHRQHTGRAKAAGQWR